MQPIEDRAIGEKPYITEKISHRIRLLRNKLGSEQFVEGMGTTRASGEPIGPASSGALSPFHAGWMRRTNASFDIRLAGALAEWWGSVEPELIPGQLVQGTWPADSVVSFHTGRPAWDFRIDKPGSDGVEAEQIISYWRGFLDCRPPIELPAALDIDGIHDAIDVSGKFCHSSQAYDLAIEHGIDGLARRVRDAASRHPDAGDWYEALGTTLEGVSAYITRHAETAESLTGDEWARFSRDCRRIAHEPPKSFLQAVQLFYFLFLLNRHDSPGRIDRYFHMPLRRDLESGALGIEEAQEIVDCLYLRFAQYTCYGSTIGGQLPEGGDATNELTWLCLNSIRRLRLLSPRTALRVHASTPPVLFEEVVRSLSTGATFPTLVNDEAIIPSMRRRGASIEHARDYTFAGCGQVIPQGRAHGSYEDVILSAVKPLMYAMHGGREERTGDLIGPATGEPESFADFEAFEEAVFEQFVFLISTDIEATNAIRRWSRIHLRDYLRSILTHSCLERGLDWRAGGADYHDGMVDVVGFTTCIDSLFAIKRIVFDENRLSLRELVDVLGADWKGNESLRSYCLHRVPKFGNENREIDKLYASWLKRINGWLFEQRTEFGGRWGMDIIGWSGAVSYGAVAGATPDGRRLGDPIADSAGPAQGRDRSGVTATLNSMLELPMSEIHGPLALNLRLPLNAVQTPEGRAKLAALLSSYFERGGQQAQVTVASVEDMRAAQREPDLHRDLMVRVGGFSAYFIELSPEYQEDMINRTEHVV